MPWAFALTHRMNLGFRGHSSDLVTGVHCGFETEPANEEETQNCYQRWYQDIYTATQHPFSPLCMITVCLRGLPPEITDHLLILGNIQLQQCIVTPLNEIMDGGAMFLFRP